MVAAAWQEFKELVYRPAEVFEGVLARHNLILSLALGTVSYYVRTLQISEILFPPYLGGRAYFLLNIPVALGYMALLVLLLHLVARFFSRDRGGWRDLLSLWGYTQVPQSALTLLALAFFSRAMPISWMSSPLVWGLLIGAVALLLSLWGLILKLQALQTCYHLDGSRLLRVVLIASLLYICCAWLERTFIDERGLVPLASRQMMVGEAVSAGGNWKNLILPFDKVTYRLRAPERGEVVGFVPPTDDEGVRFFAEFRSRFLGRVVGLSGEQVEVRGGRLLIDDHPLNERYRRVPLTTDIGATIVPDGHFFILGDYDAMPLRVYGGGFVPSQAIRGRLTEVGRLKWWLTVGTWLW
jgi:signal peptidase I